MLNLPVTIQPALAMVWQKHLSMGSASIDIRSYQFKQTER